ncbi:MAG: serine/threonine-protein phosphatase [Candidatus Gracilibacteria bacterium]|nr:serine/threonine-protein phosphatase [Candidatus Gracilibacteria bacterium]
MLGFGKQKKVEEAQIKGFKDAIKAIEVFILLSEWEKAKAALEEIKGKEKSSFDALFAKINREGVFGDEKEKKKLEKSYQTKEKQLTKLEENLKKKEQKYHDHLDQERFKVRFQKIKDELGNLVKNKRAEDAMGLLQKFLEENKDNDIVINFFNKEKKVLQKHVDKQKSIEEEKFKDNARMQAMKLIGGSANIDNEEEEVEEKKSKGLFSAMKGKLDFYSNIKKNIKRKQLFDEVNMLIEADNKVQQDLAEKKLANIHRGLVKEISNKNIIGYDLFGKILGSDKISGDTFGFNDGKEKYNFFLGDATGHGIRAGFIVTLLSRLFNKFVNQPLQELAFEINNGLKQDLKNRNFITGIFFEVNKEKINTLNFVGMGHEPMLLYRKKEKKVETVIPGGLAGGIRLIKNKDDVQVKQIEMDADDILVMYSDGIIESKSKEGEFYGLAKMKEAFEKITENESNILRIYEYLMNDVQLFKGGSFFADDVSVMILKRDTTKDLQEEKGDFLQDLAKKEGLTGKETKKLQGKTKAEIEEELERIKKEKDTQRILKILENLYYTGEILKLKQEAIRYIKQGYIHEKINLYLKKAIDNETKYKVEQKNQKMESKYAVLVELQKKGDYKTVIKEIEDIISKDGNI